MEDIFADFRERMDKILNDFRTSLKLEKESIQPLERAQTVKKGSFDNVSKSSSGYDDEETSENESVYSHQSFLKTNGTKSFEAEIKSDDEDSSEFSYFEEDYPDFIEEKPRLQIVTPLPMYPPSEQIKIANDFKFSSMALRDNHDDIIKTYLKDKKLNHNNIHFVYKMLLEIEDVTCMMEYVPLVQKDVILNCTGMAREYWISLKDCPNIEDIVVPLVDEVVLVPKDSSLVSDLLPLKFKTDILLPHQHEEHLDLFRRRIATVQKITQGRAYFRFNKFEHLSEKQIASLSTTKYDMIFRSQRLPLRYQHHAIELLSQNLEIRKYLFPTENLSRDSICQPQQNLILFNQTIASNPEQLMAVENITRGQKSNAPFVIFGPPGTGKTTITVESILQLRLRYPESQILVTAGSNSACDTIALRLCKYFDNSMLTNVDPKNQQPMIRIYSKSVVEKGIAAIDPKLLEYSNCKSRHHHYPAIEEIRQYGIIVATLCTVGKLVTADLGKMNFFTHIFMDEAGASTVPEALVAIMGIKTHSDCRLILSGDHKQLGPILTSERASQLGLEKSLMEHLLQFDCYAIDENFNYDRTLQARLIRNYRSHPEIVRLYNHLFYKNELIAEAKEEHVNLAAKWCKLPNPKFPILFQAVHGVTQKDNVSPSSFNNLEVEVVMWFLRRLINDGIDGKKVAEKDIGIITPYKLQNNRIKNRLKEHSWFNVESGSVENFQGREKQIIIVSLVRSFSGLGFVGNPKRLNVLLSRPKSLLILIGNPLTLKRNPDFAFILNECQKHGTFLRKNKTKKHKSKFMVKAGSLPNIEMKK